MDIAIDTSQDTRSPSRRPGSGLQDAATGGSRQRDTAWLMTPELQKLVDCDPGMIRDLFSLFLEDSAVRLQILGRACNDGDFKVVRAQAHSLKGSSFQIGSAGLGSLCAELELSNRPEPEECRSIMRAIDDEFILVRRAIERYLLTTMVAGRSSELVAQGGLK
jgi:HPt (histidine-containing phosphotransfer) domain-containing protein